jgi:selenocysteine lyase/cysteine desulfurase
VFRAVAVTRDRSNRDRLAAHDGAVTTQVRGSLSRRSLLVAGGAGVVAAGTAACTDRAPRKPAPPAGFDPQSWASVKAQFVDSAGHARFASFVFSPHPQPVRDAIAGYRAALDADTLEYLHANESRLDDRVAAAASRYLARPPDEIAFTDSTTMSLGVVYGGLFLAPGDEVLTTAHDFYSTHEALRLRSRRDGVSVKRVSLYDNPASASVDQIVARLKAGVTSRTRVVAVTWVHSSTGVKLPIRAIADMLSAINHDRAPGERVLLCVDGVHGFGLEGTTADDLGCDFLMSGTHKWLFGPRGTGLIWGRPQAWQRFQPAIPSFSGDAISSWLTGEARPPIPGPLATAGGYHPFEHRWAVADAFEFHFAIGPSRIASRTHELATMLKDGLAGVGTMVTPKIPELSAGIVCVAVGGGPGSVVAALRGRKVLASATPYDPSYLRLGPSLATDEKDVEAAIAAVRAVV